MSPSPVPLLCANMRRCHSHECDDCVTEIPMNSILVYVEIGMIPRGSYTGTLCYCSVIDTSIQSCSTVQHLLSLKWPGEGIQPASQAQNFFRILSRMHHSSLTLVPIKAERYLTGGGRRLVARCSSEDTSYSIIHMLVL